MWNHHKYIGNRYVCDICNRECKIAMSVRGVINHFLSGTIACVDRHPVDTRTIVVVVDGDPPRLVGRIQLTETTDIAYLCMSSDTKFHYGTIHEVRRSNDRD